MGPPPGARTPDYSPIICTLTRARAPSRDSSYLGLPLSTTHCQVGATTGVALLEGGKGINGFVLLKTAVGWVITLIVAGIGGGFLVAQAIHAPMSDGQQNAFLAQECPFYVMSKGSIEDNGACSVGEHGGFCKKE